MEELIRKAEELGRLLAEHPRFKALIAARDAVRDDAAARELLQKYQAQVEKIQQATDEGKPIEVDDKRALADLEGQVAGNDAIKGLSQAQVEFSEMMNRINRAIYGRVAPSGDTSGEAGSQ